MERGRLETGEFDTAIALPYGRIAVVAVAAVVVVVVIVVAVGCRRREERGVGEGDDEA